MIVPLVFSQVYSEEQLKRYTILRFLLISKYFETLLILSGNFYVGYRYLKTSTVCPVFDPGTFSYISLRFLTGLYLSLVLVNIDNSSTSAVRKKYHSQLIMWLFLTTEAGGARHWTRCIILINTLITFFHLHGYIQPSRKHTTTPPPHSALPPLPPPPSQKKTKKKTNSFGLETFTNSTVRRCGAYYQRNGLAKTPVHPLIHNFVVAFILRLSL